MRDRCSKIDAANAVDAKQKGTSNPNDRFEPGHPSSPGGPLPRKIASHVRAAARREPNDTETPRRGSMNGQQSRSALASSPARAAHELGGLVIYRWSFSKQRGHLESRLAGDVCRQRRSRVTDKAFRSRTKPRVCAGSRRKRFAEERSTLTHQGHLTRVPRQAVTCAVRWDVSMLWVGERQRRENGRDRTGRVERWQG
jgi:hypothetical protein